MKNVFVLLSLCLAMNACKKKESQTEQVQGIVSESAAKPVDCSVFDTLANMSANEQVKWLREKQTIILDSIYDPCREDFHKIPAATYDNAVRDYWGSNTVIYSFYTFGAIQALSTVNNYNEFIQASIVNQNVMLKAESNFTQTPNSYSIPLFNSIRKLHNFTATDTLSFTIGKIGGVNSVIFSIKGTEHCYDVSNSPI